VAIKELNCKIATERTKLTIQLTKEEIVLHIKTALKKEPQQMIELLIKRIILFDDRIEIIYNYTNGKNKDDSNPDTRRDFVFYNGSTYTPFTPPSKKAAIFRLFFSFLPIF
jgi:hypothetical protein